MILWKYKKAILGTNSGYTELRLQTSFLIKLIKYKMKTFSIALSALSLMFIMSCNRNQENASTKPINLNCCKIHIEVYTNESNVLVPDSCSAWFSFYAGSNPTGQYYTSSGNGVIDISVNESNTSWQLQVFKVSQAQSFCSTFQGSYLVNDTTFIIHLQDCRKQSN